MVYFVCSFCQKSRPCSVWPHWKAHKMASSLCALCVSMYSLRLALSNLCLSPTMNFPSALFCMRKAMKSFLNLSLSLASVIGVMVCVIL